MRRPPAGERRGVDAMGGEVHRLRRSTRTISRRWAGVRLSAEAQDKAALPGCLHGLPRVMLPHVGDRLPAGNPVQYGQAGQCRTGAATPTGAGDLDSLGLGARPCLAQRGCGRLAIRRQPEVAPVDPSGFPRDGRRLVTKQIERELRRRPSRKRAAQPSAAHETPRGQPKHSRSRRIPGRDHRLSLTPPRPAPGTPPVHRRSTPRPSRTSKTSWVSVRRTTG